MGELRSRNIAESESAHPASVPAVKNEGGVDGRKKAQHRAGFAHLKIAQSTAAIISHVAMCAHIGVAAVLVTPLFAPPNSLDEEIPVPGRLLVTFVPRLLRFTVAPFTPIDVLRPLLLTLRRMPGAILKLFRMRKAMAQFPEKANSIIDRLRFPPSCVGIQRGRKPSNWVGSHRSSVVPPFKAVNRSCRISQKRHRSIFWKSGRPPAC